MHCHLENVDIMFQNILISFKIIRYDAHQFISLKLLLLLGTYYPFCHKKIIHILKNFFGTCGYKYLISSNYTKEKINFVMRFFFSMLVL